MQGLLVHILLGASASLKIKTLLCCMTRDDLPRMKDYNQLWWACCLPGKADAFRSKLVSFSLFSAKTLEDELSFPRGIPIHLEPRMLNMCLPFV